MKTLKVARLVLVVGFFASVSKFTYSVVKKKI